MERLTAWDKGDAYYPKCFDEPCSGMGCNNERCEFRYEKCKRLAQYEDTGLSPEEIKLSRREWYQKGYDDAKKMDWIPVSERLPVGKEFKIKA